MVELLLFADLVISFFLFCALPVRLYPLTLVLCISVARTKPEELFLVHGAMFHSNNGLALVLVSICFVPKRFVLNCPFFFPLTLKEWSQEIKWDWKGLETALHVWLFLWLRKTAH